MKIGKLNVTKSKDAKLGEVLQIKVDGNVTPCFEVSEDGKLRLILSKATAVQLAQFVLLSKDIYLRTFDADL